MINLVWDYANEDYEHRSRRVGLYQSQHMNHASISALFEQEQKAELERQEEKKLGNYTPKILEPYLAQLKEYEQELAEREKNYFTEVQETAILNDSMLAEREKELKEISVEKVKLKAYAKNLDEIARMIEEIPYLNKMEPNAEMSKELKTLMQVQDPNLPCKIIATCEYNPTTKKWSFQAVVG